MAPRVPGMPPPYPGYQVTNTNDQTYFFPDIQEKLPPPYSYKKIPPPPYSYPYSYKESPPPPYSHKDPAPTTKGYCNSNLLFKICSIVLAITTLSMIVSGVLSAAGVVTEHTACSYMFGVSSVGFLAIAIMTVARKYALGSSELRIAELLTVLINDPCQFVVR